MPKSRFLVYELTVLSDGEVTGRRIDETSTLAQAIKRIKTSYLASVYQFKNGIYKEVALKWKDKVTSKDGAISRVNPY